MQPGLQGNPEDSVQKGVSKWRWDKYRKKFHHQIQVIDEWAVTGLAIHMSEEDKISSFLKMIPKDCKNSEFGIA